MFAKRTNWNLETNRIAVALAGHRAAEKPLIDLTVSNPTECGFRYDEDAILSALHNSAALKYEPNPRGLAAARSAVAQYYAERGSVISNDDIFLTTSTSEAYSYVFRTLCNPDDELLIPELSYPLFEFLADIQDVRLSRYALLYDHGWQIDFHALERIRQESHNLEAATWNYRNSRELVVLVVGGSYLQVLAAAARRDAAQSQFSTAKTLYEQAVDLKRAGMSPGIDVLRAQVEMQAQQQRLLAVSNDFEKQKLQLARVIGLPVAQEFDLTDTVPFQPAPEIPFDQAMETAYKNRSDYQAALSLEHAAESGKRAAEAERLPSLGINGDYGDVGITPGSSHGTFTATAGLRIPVFQGGKVRGDVLQADALLKQRRSELEDLRSRIEFEVHTAFLDLKTAAELVQVAQSTMGLAQEQLRQAQDRFAAGVANNIDVVQAQESLATANESYISSLNSFNLSKLSLARSLGVAETATQRYLGGTK